MKIIIVLHSMKSGGAERHALQLMRGLRARGHEALYAGPMDGWLGQQPVGERHAAYGIAKRQTVCFPTG